MYTTQADPMQTQAEYRQYQRAVAAFFEREGPESQYLSPKYSEEDADGNPVDPSLWEPHFSHAPCEICTSSLGKDRHTYHWIHPTYGSIAVAICTNCVYYLAYDQLDDQSMLDIGLDPR